jgi:hypothetical protein
MTEENIKRMALEAGFSDGEVDYIQSIIIHFATLVAQQEREKCAKRLDAVGCEHCSEVIREMGQA